MQTGWELCQSWTVGDTGITQQGKHKYKKRLRKFETKFYTTNIVRKCFLSSCQQIQTKSSTKYSFHLILRPEALAHNDLDESLG